MLPQIICVLFCNDVSSEQRIYISYFGNPVDVNIETVWPHTASFSLTGLSEKETAVHPRVSLKRYITGKPPHKKNMDLKQGYPN